MKTIIIFMTLALASTVQAATYSSEYTSVNEDDCQTLESSALSDTDEGDFYTGLCPSLGGYTVKISGGDLRYAVLLSYQDTVIQLIHPPGFHDMGSSKIEWRTRTQNGVKEYTALIYRLQFQDYNQKTGENFENEQLVVVRLNKADSCTVGVVNKQTNMNEKARKIADNLNAPCI